MSDILRKKAFIVGDKERGKAALLFALGKHIKGQEHTYKDFFKLTVNLEINNQKIQLFIRDITGSEFDSPEIHRDIDIIVLCYSIDCPNSLVKIAQEWNPKIKSLCPQAKIVLVGNKLDIRLRFGKHLANDKKKLWIVSTEHGQVVADTIGACAFVECSVIRQENINKVFEAIVEAAMFAEDEAMKSNS